MSRMNLLWRMVYVAHGHGHMLHNLPLEVGYVTYGQHHTSHDPPLEVGDVTYDPAIRDISHITHLERWVM